MCANWRQTAWLMDTTELEKLFERLKHVNKNTERTINGFLQNRGAEIIMDKIQPNIPVSPKQKKHARNSKALTAKHGNLEFTIRPKRAFEYIKYPDLAIGTSQFNKEKMFMKKGLDEGTPIVVRELIEAVQEDIEKTLGG